VSSFKGNFEFMKQKSQEGRGQVNNEVVEGQQLDVMPQNV
jgi:hypothetical protein